MSTENEARIDRRQLLVRAGTMGIGAAAVAIIAGCGGGSSASANGAIPTVSSTEVSSAFKDIKTDEDDHVTFLVAALGGAARPAPTFSTAKLTSPDITTFISQAAALENTGTGAYLAAVPLPNLIASPATLQAAASIALVEGRHAGFLNSLLNRPLLTDPNQSDNASPPASDLSREIPQPPSQVLSRASAFTGTIGNGAGFDTNLNGGPPLPTDATIGSASLTDILNYALFLEYLEKSFYDLNVPRFFP